MNETAAMASPRRFLACTDGSQGAERAVAVAAEMARAAGGDLLIMTVSTDDLSDEDMRYVESLHIAEGDVLETISRQYLQRALTCAHDHGAKKVETVLAVGDPADKIVEAVSHNKIDAIVVGRRGRGRLEGLILGSVSQKLAAQAPCIAIIVP